MNTFLFIAYKSSIQSTLTFSYDPSENVIYVRLEKEMELGKEGQFEGTIQAGSV